MANSVLRRPEDFVNNSILFDPTSKSSSGTILRTPNFLEAPLYTFTSA